MEGYYVGDCQCRWTREGPFTRFCPIHSKDRVKELEKKVEELEKELIRQRRPSCTCDKCIEKRGER